MISTLINFAVGFGAGILSDRATKQMEMENENSKKFIPIIKTVGGLAVAAFVPVNLVKAAGYGVAYDGAQDLINNLLDKNNEALNGCCKECENGTKTTPVENVEIATRLNGLDKNDRKKIIDMFIFAQDVPENCYQIERVDRTKYYVPDVEKNGNCPTEPMDAVFQPLDFKGFEMLENAKMSEEKATQELFDFAINFCM